MIWRQTDRQTLFHSLGQSLARKPIKAPPQAQNSLLASSSCTVRERKIHHVMDMYSIGIPPVRVIMVHEDILIPDTPNTRKYAQQPNKTKNTE